MLTEIRAPHIRKSDTKPSIGRWFKRPQDPVSIGEPLIEIETDAGPIEVQEPATGVLSKVLFRDGESIESGSLLGTIIEYGTNHT